MEYQLKPIALDDREAVIDLFNDYVENGFAAYPEEKVPYAFFNLFMKTTGDYPSVAVKDENGTVIGFGMLRAYNPFSTFSRVAEISYFIHPDFTGQGIGTRMLDYLTGEARKMGIASLLASIASKNEGSLHFHRKNGFVECGRFHRIGKKKGRFFDVVWMQKNIDRDA